MRRVLALCLVGWLFVSCGDPPTTLQVGEGPLVYVAMGDSFTFWPRGDGAIDGYADLLEESFGVPVEMRNHTRGGQTAENFVSRLRNDAWLRADLGEAHVITLLVPNDEWQDPIQTVMGSAGRDPAACGGDDHQQCLRDMLATHRDRIDEVFAELTAVVDPSEVLIRVQDSYMFPTDGYTPETRAIVLVYWEEAQTYLREVAGRLGIPVADVFDEFMGPEGTDNPEERGLVGVDHLHPTERGALLIAELLGDLGYSLAG